jgi:uroporphyrinogen decarboxylase
MLLDPKVFIKAQLAAYERYQPDIVLMQRDLLMDVEAIGNELKFPENGLCINTRLALEDKENLGRLKIPNPMRDGRLPDYLESLTEVRHAVEDPVVSSVIAGPWTIAIGLRDANVLLRDTMKDPGFVHELMNFSTEVAINMGEAVVPTKTGLSYSEAPASCSLISPKVYRTFILPYMKKIVAHFKEKKVGVGLHICGYADPILEDMLETGVTNISIDAPTDLAKAVEITRGRAVLIGNLNTGLFYNGSKEDFREAIGKCLAVAPRDSGYMLASGCEVPGVGPPERVDWFMEIGNEMCLAQ